MSSGRPTGLSHTAGTLARALTCLKRDQLRFLRAAWHLIELLHVANAAKRVAAFCQGTRLGSYMLSGRPTARQGARTAANGPVPVMPAGCHQRMTSRSPPLPVLVNHANRLMAATGRRLHQHACPQSHTPTAPAAGPPPAAADPRALASARLRTCLALIVRSASRIETARNPRRCHG